MSAEAPLLEVRDLSVDYSVSPASFGSKRRLQAVRQVGFKLAEGETLGIVGESGCGKSSLARTILGLVAPSTGMVLWRGRPLSSFSPEERHALRRDIQVVFQNPFASLDPRMTVRDIVAEPLTVFERALGTNSIRDRVVHMLGRVGLAAGFAERYPHQLSGGQCQRVAIARALVTEPKLVICDEPVSALDVSVQAQIVNLLKGLQRDLGLSLIFISHNMAVVRQMSARVLVMYLGRGVELASREVVFDHPRHPYTRALLASVPEPTPVARGERPDRTRSTDMPSALDPPSGCVFRTRCDWAADRCAREIPRLEELGLDAVACHRWREM
jgi:oligopeptide transport system ATP-binding protein